jgi:hypothetical protein
MLLYLFQALKLFWRKVCLFYKGEPRHLKDYWTETWSGRARDYRLLVEPVDIANWYVSETWMKSEGPHLESHSFLILLITSDSVPTCPTGTTVTIM